MHTYVAKGVL